MSNYSDINIDQGSSFSSIINVNDANGLPFDLDGYSARGQIRRSYSSLTAIDFTAVIITPTTLGQVGISLTSDITYRMKSGRYLFDVEIYNNSGDVTRIAEGQISVAPAVTRTIPIISSVSSLVDLILSYGLLTPVFDPAILTYTATFPNKTTSITVMPILTDHNSKVTVNGISIVSGLSSNDITLVSGTNVVNTVVLAQDGITSTTYTITCNI